jgi:hypothetical protein
MTNMRSDLDRAKKLPGRSSAAPLARRKEMMTEIQMVQELQGMGWRLAEIEESLYSFNKQCAGDVDVIVAIRKKDSGFEVISRSEHRCSGPSDAIVATTTTIEDALIKTIEYCNTSQKRIDAKSDWSKWKLIPPQSKGSGE